MESFVIIKAAILLGLVGHGYSADGVDVAGGHADVITKSNNPENLLKKMPPNDHNEADAYKELMKDTAAEIVPKFYGVVRKDDTDYIEMQDATKSFKEPRYVMDVKLGTRTFRQSESNPEPRKDLFKKMVNLDPNAPTPEENKTKTVTKLRYMTFKDKATTTGQYGVRLISTTMAGVKGDKEKFDNISRWEPLVSEIGDFFKFASKTQVDQIVERLKHIRAVVQKSRVFSRHEVIGCSALVIYNKDKVGVWLIDFAKFTLLPNNQTITHTAKWIMGNYEDGLLFGVDNFIKVINEARSSASSSKGKGAGAG